MKASTLLITAATFFVSGLALAADAPAEQQTSRARPSYVNSSDKTLQGKHEAASRGTTVNLQEAAAPAAKHDGGSGKPDPLMVPYLDGGHYNQ